MLKLDFLARLSKKLTPAKCFFLATKGSKAAAASYGSSQKFSTRVFFAGSPAPRYTWLFIIHDATDKFVFLGWPCVAESAFFKFRKKTPCPRYSHVFTRCTYSQAYSVCLRTRFERTGSADCWPIFFPISRFEILSP